jgi:6-phosphogluconolactonase
LDNLHVFPDSGAMAEALALRVKEEAEQAVSENRLYSVALSGGETASIVYRQFAEPGFVDRIPWELVHIFWTDERCVPPESGESNYGIAYRAFLKSISIPEKNIHRMRGEADPDIESVRYDKEVQEHLSLRSNSKNFFDVVFLGLGTDGHTASLFPGQEEIMKTPRLCEVARHPETGQSRMTLTPSAIQRSSRIAYHVIGQKKAGIVSELVLESAQRKKYPAAHILGEWYLDKAAASNLGSSEQDSN